MDKLWRFTSCGILWMLNLLSWFRCCTVEWHYRKIGFTSSCCHHFIPRCIQIQFCQRCVTLSTEAAIHQRTCAFRFISFYCFYSVYSVFIVHLCLHTKYSSMRFSFYFFFFFSSWIGQMRTKSCSPHCRKTLAWDREGHRSCCPLEGSWQDNHLREQENRIKQGTRCSLVCFCRGTAQQTFPYISQSVHSYIFTRNKKNYLYFNIADVARFISETIFGE